MIQHFMENILIVKRNALGKRRSVTIIVTLWIGIAESFLILSPVDSYGTRERDLLSPVHEIHSYGL